jgi:hypothetical protein
MDAAEWNRELITDLAPHRSRLREAQMMRIRRASSAHQAGLRSDERPVILVSLAPDLAKGQFGTVRV